ncbi:MAG: oligosaccharide flippase family protein, partial [Anaerolineales bacterium]
MEAVGNLVRNTAFRSVRSILLRGTSLLYAVLVVRFLSKEQYGLLALTLTVVALANGLTNLGLPVMALKSVSESFGKNIDKAASSFRFILRVYGAITFICGVLLLLASPLIGKIYGRPEMVGLMRLGSLLFILLSFHGFYERVVVAINKYGTYVFKIDLPKEALVLLGAVVLIRLGYQAEGPLMAQIVAYSFAVIILTLLIFKNLKGASVPVDRRGIVRGALEITPQSWASTAVGNTHILILGAFVALPVLASYKVALSVLIIAVELLAFGMFVLPTLAQLSMEEAETIFNKMLRYSLIGITPIMFLFYSFSREILWVLFGSTYAADYPILSVLAFLLLWQILAPVFVHTLVHLNQMRGLSKMWGLTALLNAALMYAFVRAFGLAGAIVVSYLVSYGLLFAMGARIHAAGIKIDWAHLKAVLASTLPLLLTLPCLW